MKDRTVQFFELVLQYGSQKYLAGYAESKAAEQALNNANDIFERMVAEWDKTVPVVTVTTEIKNLEAHEKRRDIAAHGLCPDCWEEGRVVGLFNSEFSQLKCCLQKCGYQEAF